MIPWPVIIRGPYDYKYIYSGWYDTRPPLKLKLRIRAKKINKMGA